MYTWSISCVDTSKPYKVVVYFMVNADDIVSAVNKIESINDSYRVVGAINIEPKGWGYNKKDRQDKLLKELYSLPFVDLGNGINGYTKEDLMTIFTDTEYNEFQKFMYGQTAAFVKEKVLYYGHDVSRFIRRLPIID